MDEIIINERIKLIDIEYPEYIEGAMFATLTYKKDKYRKKFNFKYDYIENRIVACASGAYIEIEEGDDIWDIIRDKLVKNKHNT